MKTESLIHLWLLQSKSVLQHMVQDEYLWRFMDTDYSRSNLSWDPSLFCCDEEGDAWLYFWESLGPPGPARGHQKPRMPRKSFFLSSWLLKQSWHLRCCLLEPFAVTLGTNASFKEPLDLVCMPGGVAQGPPSRYPSPGWALSAGRAIGR